MKFKVGDVVVVRKDSYMYEYTKGMIFRIQGTMSGFMSEHIIYQLSVINSETFFYPLSEGNLILYKDMVRDRLLDFIKKLL